MGRLGLELALGSGPHVVGRLGSGMGVSASFHIMPRRVGRLGLGLEPHVVGQLGSWPRVGTGGISGGVFGRGLSPEEVFSGGG